MHCIYVIMPWWAEPQRHTVVVVFVCVCVCVILQRAFLHDRNELSNEIKVAMQLQVDILTPLNWLNFCFKALLSSYSVICSP